MRKWLAIIPVLAALVLAPLAGLWAQALRSASIGSCALSSVSTATLITGTTCQFASFTGALAGTTLTVSALASGAIIPGQTLSGTGIAAGTIVSGVLNAATNGVGTYSVNNSQTVASEAMTTGGVPLSVNYMVACSYTQASNWRDDLVAPTAVVGTGGQGIPAGSCIPYDGPMGQWQVIQQTATAVVRLSFYRRQ